MGAKPGYTHRMDALAKGEPRLASPGDQPHGGTRRAPHAAIASPEFTRGKPSNQDGQETHRVSPGFTRVT